MTFLTTERLEEISLTRDSAPPADKLFWEDPRTDNSLEYWHKKLMEHLDHPLKEKRKRNRKTSVFLSYSHYDKKWAYAASLMLELIDGDLYIDLRDYDLPNDPSVATANILREKIANAEKFMVVVTDRTRDSVWVPWELGVADGIKGFENIAILPLSIIRGFEVQEYLATYNRVENSHNDLLTVYDEKRNTAQLFPLWVHNMNQFTFPKMDQRHHPASEADFKPAAVSADVKCGSAYHQALKTHSIGRLNEALKYIESAIEQGGR